MARRRCGRGASSAQCQWASGRLRLPDAQVKSSQLGGAPRSALGHVAAAPKASSARAGAKLRRSKSSWWLCPIARARVACARHASAPVAMCLRAKGSRVCGCSCASKTLPGAPRGPSSRFPCPKAKPSAGLMPIWWAGRAVRPCRLRCAMPSSVLDGWPRHGAGTAGTTGTGASSMALLLGAHCHWGARQVLL